jgi:hypothetical protein
VRTHQRINAGGIVDEEIIIMFYYIIIKMAKGASSSTNGGILGSGVFGLFGTTIKCESTDDSYYCNIMKLFNLLVVIAIVLFVLYYAYLFMKNTRISNRRK